MIEFRLNLIRDRVPSASGRRYRYWAMIVYLAAAGLMLAGTLGLATARLVEARGLARQRDELEATFRAGHGGAGEIRQHVRDMDQRTGSQMNTLRTVHTRIVESARPAGLIYALVTRLPQQSNLQRFSLNADEKTVTFDVLVMGGGGGQAGGASELVAALSGDLRISSQLDQITFLGSQMDGNMARNDLLWRFSGILKPRGL